MLQDGRSAELDTSSAGARILKSSGSGPAQWDERLPEKQAIRLGKTDLQCYRAHYSEARNSATINYSVPHALKVLGS